MVYGVASFGLSINYLYCCGDLTDVKVSVKVEEVDECGMEMEMEGGEDCCQNDAVTLKIVSEQQPVLQQDYNFELFVAEATPLFLYNFTGAYQHIQLHPQYHNLPPPLVLDRTILHNNFRI